MSTSRKYASLPGIDNAPDIYETPDLIDDTSSIPDPSTTARSPSSTRSIDDAEASGITRQRLDPNEARLHFLSSDVDARDVDFSDRISNKQRSYRTSARRRHRRGQDGYASSSDDDEPESLGKRLARLRSEMLEVKAEVERRQMERHEGGETLEDCDGADNLEEVESLSGMLDTLRSTQHVEAGDPITRLEKMLNSRGTISDLSQPRETPLQQRNEQTAPPAPLSRAEDLALSRAAEIDSRLTLLEKALGMPGITPLASSSLEKAAPNPILPTLTTLQNQLSLLSSPPSSASLDTISAKVHQLVSTTERLDEARKSALASYQALQQQTSRRPLSSSTAAFPNNESRHDLSALEDPDHVSKINALYGTISTIEALAPLLPQVLDRLHSLRIVHAEAASASQSLDALESKQAEMGEDIRRWREGLEKVEEVVKRAEGGMRGNIGVVEGWVRDLEMRVGKME